MSAAADRAARAPGRLASLAAPALATLVALGILLSLGFWQLDRLRWKEALIAQIASRAHGAPGEIVPESAWPAWRAADDEFRKVELSGTFQAELAVPILGLAEPRPGQAAQGVYLFTPLRREDGSVVIVNRGFVPTERRSEVGPVPGGPTRIVGLVRAPETRPLFVPENDAARDRWFVRDVGDIARAKGLDRVAPFYVDTDATPQPGGWPRGGQTPLTLRNNHLGYAATWFGLAATLVGVFAALAWTRLRGWVPGSTGELQADDAGHDQRDAEDPGRRGRVAEQRHP